MHVTILGAGVVGVTTAFYLNKQGHEVTVLERNKGAGHETSYGNAGGLCPSFAGPWAAPGMIAKVARQAFSRHSPIRVSPGFDPKRLAWIRQWMKNCEFERFKTNKTRMQRIAHYSFACLKDVVEDISADAFDFHVNGTLQLFRTEAELELGRISAAAIEQNGVPAKILAPDRIVVLESALSRTRARFTGALYLPSDGSGDSYKFVQKLESYLTERGVSFVYDANVTGFEYNGDRIGRVRTSRGDYTADAFVVALGSYAPLLMARLGLKLPIYPLKGYSITVPVIDEAQAPRAAVMDEHNKVMISRLGNRVRAAGMAELMGYDLRLDVARSRTLLNVVRELFPVGLDLTKVSTWTGLRPMTPDGPPILGRTPWPNLYLNSGHGSNGWTQSCGAAKIVADMIDGRQPDIDIEGLTADRFFM